MLPFSGFLASSLVVIGLLACTGVRGDACENKQFDCRTRMSAALAKVTSLFHPPPPNVTAIITECQATQDLLTNCVEEIGRLCSAVLNITVIRDSMQATHDSVCSKETIFNMQLLECNQKMLPYTQEISDASSQRPPNVELVSSKCSQMKKTVTPCMTKVAEQCGNMTGISESVASIRMSMDSLCSKATLCQMQVGTCMASLGDMSRFGDSSKTVDSEDIRELCRRAGEAKRCMSAEIDAECESLPQIQSMRQTVNNQVTSICSDDLMKCPQVMQCLFVRSDENSEECRWQGSMMSCIARLKGTCQVKEGRITFEKIEELSQQFCEEMKATSDKDSECAHLGRCVMTSDLMRRVYGGNITTASTPNIQVGLLLDSTTWCQFLEVSAGCYVSSGETCQLTPSLMTFMKRQHKELNDVCPPSSTGVNTVTGDLILVLLLAVFTAGARLHF